MTALYGSFHNRLMERETVIMPEVGMGATELCYTDRNPYTVIKVIAKNRILVQADNMQIAEGDQGTQDWVITQNPNGRIETLIKTRKGWKVLGGSTYFRLGVRDAYFDYSF